MGIQEIYHSTRRLLLSLNLDLNIVAKAVLPLLIGVAVALPYFPPPCLVRPLYSYSLGIYATLVFSCVVEILPRGSRIVYSDPDLFCGVLMV